MKYQYGVLVHTLTNQAKECPSNNDIVLSGSGFSLPGSPVSILSESCYGEKKITTCIRK